MLNGRLYRLSFVPLILALVIAAFSLGARPHGDASTLAPDAFEGQAALAELQSLARAYPDRRPGSPGDEALAARIAGDLRGLGGPAHGGFSVHAESYEAQTAEGPRQLINVVAERPGSTGASPIVIVAHRDAYAPGSEAQLSGTAALIELARVFATRATKRTIIIVSSDAGDSGAAGAAALAASLPSPVDAAIVLGDLAGTHVRSPLVLPYSDAYGSASLALQRTVGEAVVAQAGVQPGAPSTLGQLAHLAVPLTAGEQGPLDAAGIPAVLVQTTGERGPRPAEAVSGGRLEGLGRAVLGAVDALDTAPDVSPATQTSVVLQKKTLPAWAVRLLVLALLLGPAIVAADGLARLGRRRARVGNWTLWTLSCALPFVGVALVARVLGLSGAIPAPPAPAAGGALHIGGAAVIALVALALCFGLGWLLWRGLARRLCCGVLADPEVAGVPMLLVLLAVAFLAWLRDPYAALLLVPAVHLWLLLASGELRPRRALGLALALLGAAPAALLVAFYVRELGLGVGSGAWTGVLLLSGGQIGVAGAILWSLALGCGVVAGMLALSTPPEPGESPDGDPLEITIRGPLSYAGPGSLGGTRSALRR